MKENRIPFPQALDALLEDRDWSARELSRQLRSQFGRDGAAHSTVAKWLQGKADPGPDSMEMVAHVLRIPPEHFPEWRLDSVRKSLNWRLVGVAGALASLERLRAPQR